MKLCTANTVLTGLMIVAASLLANGCTAQRYFESQRLLHGPTAAAVADSAAQAQTQPAEDVRQLAMFSGRDGRAMGWRDVMNAVAWADVICLGEQHNDPVGHAVQRAVLEDTLDRWPDAQLALEMLERDEQVFVDDYLDDILKQKAFVERTNSANWGAAGKWDDWYQPLIDEMKSHNARVIAANAPRRYVRLARSDGYERLRRLPAPRGGLVVLPRGDADARYRQRFYEVMAQAHPSDEADEAESDDAETHEQQVEDADHDVPQSSTQPDAPAETDDATHHVPHTQPEHHAPQEQSEQHTPHEQPAHHAAETSGTDPFVESLLRAQRVWDATMADSIVRARPTQQRKVLLCVGQFHVDFEGGTVQQIRARRPSLRVLTISMRPEDTTELLEDDADRADIVIYTGAPTAEDEPSEETTESKAEHDAHPHAEPNEDGERDNEELPLPPTREPV